MDSLLHDYDARSGAPESSFCQDNQGLAQRKRRKKNFVALFYAYTFMSAITQSYPMAQRLTVREK